MLALVTCVAARGHDPDLPILTAAMPEAVVVDWDGAGVDWAAFDAAFLETDPTAARRCAAAFRSLAR